MTRIPQKYQQIDLLNEQLYDVLENSLEKMGIHQPTPAVSVPPAFKNLLNIKEVPSDNNPQAKIRYSQELSNVKQQLT